MDNDTAAYLLFFGVQVRICARQVSNDTSNTTSQPDNSTEDQLTAMRFAAKEMRSQCKLWLEGVNSKF